MIEVRQAVQEAANYLGQLGEPLKGNCREVFGRGIALLGEQYVPSAEVVQDSGFAKLSLTDTVIARLAEGSLLVLTDDLRLATFLERIPVDVVNFNHLRPLPWR